MALPEGLAEVRAVVDTFIARDPDDASVAASVQRTMVGRLCEVFEPLYRSSRGTEGFVTIQGDPMREEASSFIVSDGLESRSLAPNVMVKIPVTEPGIKAIASLAVRDIPVMATEVMAISQMFSICSAYMDACSGAGNYPPFYVTHITGILDDYFKIAAAGLADPPSDEVLRWAGLAVAKRQYAMLKEQGWPISMIGGGARKLEDFTELVGGDLSVTINWEGTADVLIAKDLPVVSRIGDMVDSVVVDELLEKLPDFGRAWRSDGMTAPEYYDYGGVALFRNAFLRGWRALLDLVAQRRRERP
jgi:transaldolase